MTHRMIQDTKTFNYDKQAFLKPYLQFQADRLNA